ncbi:metallophosphoesterase family protein [Occallatibacter riparius]|uniref:Metallophosphoesterase n=1 Tax=Occallatibacter riparius TaxID=1002689 RepID=A0A9J7BPZ6_9BACT|nr:metallophosphoesterase [Occallatibacter riparius]UWZ84671.1 metallophosphoesterase [Occallatibacter riparius]
MSKDVVNDAPVPDAHDGIDRRNFLSCMAWAGTGLLWSMVGGVPSARLLGQSKASGRFGGHEDFTFAHISDSHIGFNKGANPDVSGTLRKAIDRANTMAAGMKPPDFLLHTGDITQNSKATEFDTAAELNKSFRGEVFYVPGEHDFIDDGEQYKQRFGKNTVGNGWYSFNHKGVHFVGLNNCVQVDAMGNIGAEQLAWMRSDLAGLSASTPIVVFAHIPLWMVYEKWGWGTGDAAQALALLKRFGSVTVLNGHIHQVMQKVEGNVSFHTAMSTAFPQPAPGAAPNPGPMTVAAGKLASVIGITDVRVVRGHSHLAVVDHTLGEGA